MGPVCSDDDDPDYDSDYSDDDDPDYDSDYSDSDALSSQPSNNTDDDAHSNQTYPPTTSNSGNLDCSCSDYGVSLTGVIFEPFGPGVSVFPFCEEGLDYIPDPKFPPVILPVTSGRIIFHESLGVKNTLQVSEDCTSLIALYTSENERGYRPLSSSLWVSVVEDKKRKKVLTE